ncbi:hypothetical protein [Actinoplanes friuliensis]|uniref:hypothetical protein n=1 Tax=Actinoplanes friuliensis TaxID=196914 RepID=UPI0005A01318|nr:hypothetical protein [Actinoplanes friuliensis]
MTRLRGSFPAAAVVTLFLLGACAQTTGAGAAAEASGSPVPPAIPGDSDTLVLRVAYTGGFVGPDALAGRMPETSVYADGRVIFNGPVPASYPGPAVPNVQLITVSPDTLRELVDGAVAAGVREGTDFGQPGVADAPSTEVSVLLADGRRQAVAAEALAEAQADDPMLTAPQKQARKELLGFIDKLDRLTTQPTSGTPQPYKAETLAAIVTPWVDPGDDLPGKPKAIAWPGPALPGESLSPTVKINCVAATGAEAKAVLDAAAEATAITPWTSGGKTYSVRLRPLLPEETGCADLKAVR